MYVAQQIGRYHLLDRIAIGGMAEIYRAITFDSRGHQHMVAIKRVLRQLADDDDFLQMLVDEAKVAILLDHPNIAKVYEFSRVGDDYFIAMEYVDGRDVRAILERLRSAGGWLAPEHCAYIVMRILEALQTVHETRDGAGRPLRVVHRDISPSNLLVAYDSAVKLCDFGIAKTVINRIQTRAGVIKGKVKYMSPEQAMGHPLDRRSDLFSAGSVLYELLTKQPPFNATGEMDLIFKVRDARFVRPSRYNPRVPEQLTRVLRRALARLPEHRFQSAAEFAGVLRRFIEEHAPGYDPRRLGRAVRRLFAREIEQDLRLMEQFVFGEVDPAAVGDNLLAEVLGEGATYTQFTAAHPGRWGGTLTIPTRLMPRVPAAEERLAEGVDLHEMRTLIIDLEEQRSRVRVRREKGGRPRPGLAVAGQRPGDTQVKTEPWGVEPPTDREAFGPNGQIANPAFHEQPTRIIQLPRDARKPRRNEP